MLFLKTWNIRSIFKHMSAYMGDSNFAAMSWAPSATMYVSWKNIKGKQPDHVSILLAQMQWNCQNVWNSLVYTKKVMYIYIYMFNLHVHQKQQSATHTYHVSYIYISFFLSTSFFLHCHKLPRPWSIGQWKILSKRSMMSTSTSKKGHKQWCWPLLWPVAWLKKSSWPTCGLVATC